MGIPASKLAIDLNVLDVHEPPSPFGCRKQTGPELFQILRNASTGGTRIIIYAESTISDCDLPNISSAVERPPDVVFPSPQEELLSPMHINWCSSDLSKITDRGEEVLVEYESPTHCYLAFSKEPRNAWLDGQKEDEDLLVGDGEWILRLPSGKHTARIVGESQISYEVEIFSYHEARFLLFFAMTSCGILVSLYMHTRFRRSRHG